MSARKLARLEKNIESLKAQLSHKWDVLVEIAPEEQERIKQQIQRLKENIREFEQEKWELVAQLTEDISIEETEAETIVAEIVAKEGAIATKPETPPEVLRLLQQILDKLNEPEPNAAAKLKGIISTFPPFIGIVHEAELDLEQSLRRYFPTFRQWGRGISDRLKK